MLTNFNTIKNNINRLNELEQMETSAGWQRFPRRKRPG